MHASKPDLELVFITHMTPKDVLCILFKDMNLHSLINWKALKLI